MFLMNRFFEGEFLTFGLDVIAHMEADQEDRMDPMIYIFPRMTKCTFYKYGVSGEVNNPVYLIKQYSLSSFVLMMIRRKNCIINRLKCFPVV